MTAEIITQEPKKLSNAAYRIGIMNLEEKLRAHPGAMEGDCFPLEHKFADGVYIRQITMPKGALLTSKIHKVCHPYFILKGDVSVLTEDGIKRLKAPYSGITPAGTKRLLYIHEETVWTTIHVTKERALEKIEDQVIAKDFSEIPFKEEEVIKFIEEIKSLDEIKNDGGAI